MKIHITGHHIEVTAALDGYIREKIQKLAHHVEAIDSVYVVLRMEKLLHKAEATVTLGKLEFHASDEREDMYISIEHVVDKLDRQLIKHKEKVQSHRD